MKKIAAILLMSMLVLSGCEEHTEPSEEEIEAMYDDIRIAFDAGNTMDFSALHDVNPDIHAWLTIDGTVIDYPILQHPEDDLWYLDEAPDGTICAEGSLFTQASYNSRDFSDPVTVIYGNYTGGEAMFGTLQKTYSDPRQFSEFRKLTLYLPEEVRQYEVFAAVPFDDTHILYTYDFSDTYWYRNFFSNVRKIRKFGANFNESIMPEYGDQVIILSTALEGQADGRYLVMAVLQEAADAGNTAP